MGLKIDVLFPNPDIPLPKILGNIASRGVLFAIVITPLNEEHNSMTVNILQVRMTIVFIFGSNGRSYPSEARAE